MVKRGEEELAKFFGNAFREVVLPHLEELKSGVDENSEKLEKVEYRLDRITASI